MLRAPVGGAGMLPDALPGTEQPPQRRPEPTSGAEAGALSYVDKAPGIPGTNPHHHQSTA